jgi:hypothetical protein
MCKGFCAIGSVFDVTCISGATGWKFKRNPFDAAP